MDSALRRSVGLRATLSTYSQTKAVQITNRLGLALAPSRSMRWESMVVAKPIWKSVPARNCESKSIALVCEVLTGLTMTKDGFHHRMEHT